jgi:uncharacterized protein (TIGR03435 family)
MAFDVEGGPSWIRRDRFDIIAKADHPAPTAELRGMIRTLLNDRFKLTVHDETRTGRVYALVVADRRGKLGANLRRAAVDCATLRQTARQSSEPPCMVMRPGVRNGRGLELDQLASMLSPELHDRVVDNTGLVGIFDWDLKYTPPAFMDRAFDRERFPSVDPDGPSIETALQEQLGLKLVRQEGTREVLVIDRAESLRDGQ